MSAVKKKKKHFKAILSRHRSGHPKKTTAVDDKHWESNKETP